MAGFLPAANLDWKKESTGFLVYGQKLDDTKRKIIFLKNQNTMKGIPMLTSCFVLIFFCAACNEAGKETSSVLVKPESQHDADTADYFLLRPEVEKLYGYTHAVRIGNDIKISGAVSMDDKGNLTAPGSMEQQMKNCYSDLQKILQHYGYSFDDVIVENVFTTNMAEFINVSGFRSSIYKKQFPTGTWLEVKGLALPGQLIEIDMEAHKANK